MAVEFIVGATIVALAGGAVVGSEAARVRAQRTAWVLAAQQLGLVTQRTGFLGQVAMRGQVEGVPIRLSFVRDSKKTDTGIRAYGDVSAAIRLPLPAGFTARPLSPAERVMPHLMRAVGIRDHLATIDTLVFQGGDVPAGRAVVERPAFEAWAREAARSPVPLGIISGRLSMREFPADQTEVIVAAVRRAVTLVKSLEASLGWQPETEAALSPGGGALTAFAAPSLPEDPPSPRDEAHPTTSPSGEGDEGRPEGSRADGPGDAEPRVGRLDQIAAELAAEGTAVASGGFTLDREAALRKLRARRVVRAETYLLELLRAARLRGASQIQISTDLRALRVAFDGEPFTARELDQVYAAAFASDPEPRVQSCRHLALALEGALALGPTELRIEGEGMALSRAPDRPDRLERLREGAPPTRFTLRMGVARSLGGRVFREDLALVRSQARFIPAQLVIDGQPLPAAPAEARWLGLRRLELAGPSAPIDAHVGLAMTEEDPELSVDEAIAWIGRHGVWIERRVLEAAPPGLRVVLMAQDLDTDLSGERLVHNGAMDRVLAAVDAAIPASVIVACEDFHRRHAVPEFPAEAAARRLRALAAHYLTPRQALAAERESDGPVVRALRRARIWPTLSGRPASLGQIIERAGAGGPVDFVDVTVPELPGLGDLEREAASLRLAERMKGPILDASALEAPVRAWLAGVAGGRLRSRTAELIASVAEG